MTLGVLAQASRSLRARTLVATRIVGRANRSLRARILVTTLVLVALAMGIAAVGFERAARDVILSAIRAHLEARAHEVQDGVARFQRERALTVQNWADADSMQLTIESGDPKFAEDYLRRTVQDQYGAVEYALLLATDGWILAAVRHDTVGERRGFALDELRGGYVDMASLKGAKEGEERVAAVMPLRAIVAGSPDVPRVVLASPVKDFLGDVVGVLVATVDETAIARVLHDVGGEQHTFRPVAFAASAPVVVAVDAGEAAAAIAKGRGELRDGLERYPQRDGEALLVARTTPHGELPNWVGVMTVDESYALGRLSRLRLILGTLWLGVLVAAVVASVVTLKRAARPLSDVSASMQKVATGDLSTRLEGDWTDELGTLVSSFNTMVSEVQRSRDELKRTEALRREVAIAHEIQTGILPVSPRVAGFEIAARMKPADDIGGDLFDILPFDDTFWVVVGDVSGHGLNSGLVMMMAQAAAAAAIVDAPGTSPTDVIAAVNGVVYENVRRRMGRDDYVTLMAARHVGGGRFVAAGAHQPIFIARRDGTVDVIEPEGGWCGIGRRAAANEYFFDVGPGETLCLITDGIVESRGEGTELFGEDRLREVLARKAGAPATESLFELFSAVERFSSVQADDMTAVLLRRHDDA